MTHTCTLCKQPGHNAHSCTNPPIKKITRRRGGQPGNTNALKHGFYASRFKIHDRQSLSLINDHVDISSEIKLLRIAIDRVLGHYHDDIDPKRKMAMFNIFIRATGRIGRLIKIQKLIECTGRCLEKPLDDNLADVATELGNV
jgi:hypothetical protein